MKKFMLPTAAVLLLSISTFLTGPTVAQQKRQTPAKPQPRVAPTPAPTFETLIPADSYTFYGEIRGVGQLIRSSAATDILDPIFKLAGPPKEFTTMVKWLNGHADELMTSRLLVATWPSAKEVPQMIVAIEFASTEEAAKFAKPLNEYLTTVLPPTVQQESSPDLDKLPPDEKSKAPTPTATPGPPKPSYYMQQSGSLILLTEQPLNLKKLKPAGSKLLSDDNNFRAARNRFNSEPVFAFIDVKSIERQEEEQRKKYEAMRVEEQKKREEAAEEAKKSGEMTDAERAEEEQAKLEAEQFENIPPEPMGVLEAGEPKDPPPPDPVSEVMGLVMSSFSAIQPKWPEGVALALSLENESFDVRALFLNQPGEKTDAVPFFPLLVPGQSFVPESPNILPADSELVVTMSLDLPQIYSLLTRPRPTPSFVATSSNAKNLNQPIPESPFAALEKQLKLSVKDDVLPMLGSEIAVRLPVKDWNILGLMRPRGGAPSEEKQSPNAAPVLLISLRDKEGVRALMPKLIETMGFKGASALAQTERRDDTEIVSYAGFFSYAFVGNFIVLSAEPATIRFVVDSYLKRETLAGDSQFKNFTRWQPRPLQGQLFISSALMDSYKTWIQQPGTRMSDDTRAFLTRLSEVGQPITYSLSNEGLGPLHELHLPKNLVLMAVAGISGESNPPPEVRNERRAMTVLHSIAYAQRTYKDDKGKGTYGTLEQLLAEELISKEQLEGFGYKLDLTVTGDSFELFAVPLEYRKTGTISYFIDQTFIIRGADRNGASATSSDPPIN